MFSLKKIITVKRVGGAAAFIAAIAFSLMLLNWPNARAYRQSLLIDAALRGNVGRMKLILAMGASADEPACQSNRCLTPLVAAALAGHADAVQLLLDRGANIDRKLTRGQTALIDAAFNGHTDTVKLLIAKGADLNSEFDGCTALGFAKLRGHTDIGNLLSKAGANRDDNCE
jgi:ankyrin repeat protein